MSDGIISGDRTVIPRTVFTPYGAGKPTGEVDRDEHFEIRHRDGEVQTFHKEDIYTLEEVQESGYPFDVVQADREGRV